MTAWLGEITDKFDLFVGERPDLLAIDADYADKLAFFEHRHRERSVRRQVRRPIRSGRARHNPPLRISASWTASFVPLHASSRSGSGSNQRFASPRFRECRRRVVHRDVRKAVFFMKYSVPNLALQTRVALSSIFSNTG